MNIQRTALTLLASITTIALQAAPLTPYYSIRSQSVDAARQLAGWTQHVNLNDMDNIYGSFSATPEYTRSFKGHEIAECLFGANTCNSSCSGTTIGISGSQVANRNPNDWLADYFYLPTDFKSSLHFNPVIENVLVDMSAYIGWDRWVNGLFFRINAPLTWTRWNLNFRENVSQPGTNPYDAGYFAPQIIDRAALLPNFTAYAAGDAIADLQSSNTLNQVTFDGLHFAHIGCSQTALKLSDIQMVFGWNFINCHDYHLGVGLRVAAPTGSRVESTRLFEPIVGNGKHWEAGGHITTHLNLWENEDEDYALGFYADANITHLFRTRQKRTFDLKNKPMSRYMLAEKMGTPVVNGLEGGTPNIAPIAQFQNEFAPIANISTQDVMVHVAVQVDLAAQLTYSHNGLAWDLGYNFWMRSCEQVRSLCTSAGCSFVEFDENWAIKGDADVFGFASAADASAPTLTLNQAVGLSATQSEATINSGKNFPAIDNAHIDSPELAFAGGTPTPLDVSPTIGIQTNTSIQPRFITANDLDIVGTRGKSNKVYTHISYSWLENENLIPYLGAGMFAEFGNNHLECSNSKICTKVASCLNECQTNCGTCSLSQWGVWAKGGFSF